MDAVSRLNGYWPKRVLESIFDNLHFRTRVNARLVCRHWYNVQLAAKYVDQDKIVCRGYWPTNHVTEFLYACRGGGRLKNVEFQCVHFTFKNHNSVFWTGRGWQIREIRFLDCRVDRQTFECVVKCCVNLRSLYWDDRGKGIPICTRETLDSLIDERVSRGNLRAFETTGAVSFDWLHKFRQIFPEARQLSYILDARDGEPKKNAKTFAELNLREISDEKLSLKFRNLSKPLLRKTVASTRDLTTLQEIEIHVDANSERLPEKTVRQLIYRQSNLQKLTWLGIHVHFFEELMKVLFQRCPELDWLFLQLEGDEELHIHSGVVESIKLSQLRHLRLTCPKIVFKNAQTPTKNGYLRYLAIKAEMDYFSYHVLFKYFGRLDHVELDGLMNIEELITPISTYASQITSLRVVSANDLEKKPQRIKFSVKTRKTRSDLFFSQLAKLTNLTHLSIHFAEDVHKEGLDEFQLPKLEYLYASVEGGSSVFFKALLDAIARSKRLRAASFFFSKVDIPFKSWSKFCSTLECLEYLATIGSWNGVPQKMLTKIERDQLFHSSRSLRVLVRSPVALPNLTDESHVYDRIDNKILTYTRDHDYYGYSINSPDLERYFVDWLRF